MANLTSTTITGTLNSTSTITGPGSGISAVNASNVSSGTLASDRLPTVPTTKGGTGLTSIGSADQVLKVNSGGTALEFGEAGGGLQLFNIVKVTTTSTYTPTAGTTFVRVYCTGGGGGSGGYGTTGNDSGSGNGGAGGNTGVKHYTATELGATGAIIIGAGGSAGTGNTTSPSNGGTGGQTSFNPAGTGATLTGSGGNESSGFVGARGGQPPLSWNTSTGNSDYIHFGSLGSGIVNTLDYREGTTDYYLGTAGGTSFFGVGGQAQRQQTSTARNNGTNAPANSGGGGGGCVAKQVDNGAFTMNGGAGGSGVVVIEEYA